MKIPNSCRDISGLLLAREDRSLSLGERLAVRVHILTCRACHRFERQTLVLRGALRQWREHQRDEGDPQ